MDSIIGRLSCHSILGRLSSQRKGDLCNSCGYELVRYSAASSKKYNLRCQSLIDLQVPIMSKFICNHCEEEFENIRTARTHHGRCGKIKFGDEKLSCADLKGRAVDKCFTEKEAEVKFERMEKPTRPEVTEHSLKSAFERQTAYDRLGKEFFPEGPCHPNVTELPLETLDSAWELFEKLEKRAEKATSMAAKSVNRNCVGHKKKDFRPMQGFHCAYIKSLAMLLQFLKDLNPDKTSFELLEDALKEPVHKDEPSIIKFLVYLHAFDQDFKDMDIFQHTCMHLMRVFRGVCLEMMDRDGDASFEGSSLVDPSKPNVFSALERVYKIAKGLLKKYGNVRIFNAEASQRPKGHEDDPRSAVYINTNKGRVLCTFKKLQNVLEDAYKEADSRMDELQLPKFTPDMLGRVKDFDIKTPGAGLMTENDSLWGVDPESVQLKLLEKYNTIKKVKTASQLCDAVCLGIVSGVVNHMAPAGQRMPELASITMLEQENGKRRMVRFYSSRVCIVGDYKKNDASDLEMAFWFADETVSCLLCRLAIFLKPIHHTLSVKCQEPHANQVPYMMATHPVRIINNNYNALLANAGLPSCMYMRQVKESWTKACVARMKDSAAAEEYTASCLAHHSDGSSKRQYGLHLDTVVQAHQTICQEWHEWVLGRKHQNDAVEPQPTTKELLEHSGIHDEQSQELNCDLDAGFSEEYQLPDEFMALRPLQRTALEVILRARHKSVEESRVTTAAIVIPTGAGKDLLPLALAHCCKGTSVLFVPYVHLLESSAKYAVHFGGTAELYESARIHHNSAADVVICSYEHAENAITLIQNLTSRQQLVGIFFNEAQELDPSLVSYRSFDPVSKMFALLSFHRVHVPVIFMTATMRHPERILAFCGLRPIMDEEFRVG
jgi:hypothetical protein